MSERVRPYTYYDMTISVCRECLRRVDAKIVFQNDRVFMHKRCPEHGMQKVLIADDIAYYKLARETFIKPSDVPQRFNTPIRWGCPYDCGLCPDHEQHSCLTVLEITDRCNLRCPICYAGSSPDRTTHRSLETVVSMLDAIVANEGQPDVVQISGGEPTLHPDFFAILDAARARPIRHLMLNTNGIRIANDREFVARLAEYKPGFEVYLQFDSLQSEPLRELRGADLHGIRRAALRHLDEFDISTTLVVTVKKGCNDGELGDIIDFALEHSCIRGVTFQPVQHAGRAEGFDSAKHRLTLTEVRRRILDQSSIFTPADLIPVPCHPDSLCMAYAIKTTEGVVPLTGKIDPQVLLGGAGNTIVFEKDPALQAEVFKLFSTAHSPQSATHALGELLCCLPKIETSDLDYRNVFRVIIMQFMDAETLDVRSVKKSCVHIVHPDGRLIPFDTFNMFYRDDLEETVLTPLRAAR